MKASCAPSTPREKVFHITPEGEHYLDEHRDVLDEILKKAADDIDEAWRAGT